MGGVIVIFGGAGGIGEATARAVTAKGYRAHLVGRNEARLAAAAGSIAGATYSVADVTDSGAITQAVAAAAEQGGGALAGLCYAAGTITLKPVARISEADVLNDFRINALGAFQAVQAALPALHPSAMRAQRLSLCRLPSECICQEVARLLWLDPRAVPATSCSNPLALERQLCADGAGKALRQPP